MSSIGVGGLTPTLRKFCLAFILCGLFLAYSSRPAASRAGEAFAADAPSPGEAKRSEAEFVAGEILVRYRSKLTARKAEGRTLVAQGTGREIPLTVESFPGSEMVEGLRLARVTPAETLAAIEALNHQPDVLYAEPNYILRQAALPNDTYYSELYNLKDRNYSSFNQAGINAEKAWDTTTGSSDVVVGIVDTGIDTEHPDLKDNIWTNPGESGLDAAGHDKATNGLDDDGDGYVDDLYGWDFYNNDKTVFDSPTIDAHGTHVAGIIGAVGNNGLGVTGVNWRVKMMALKFLGTAKGEGTTAGALAALGYARMMRERGVNLRVLNNSWGGGPFQQSLLDAIQALNGAGVLFVAGAGNATNDNDSFPDYPSGFDAPNVLAVGATSMQGSPAPFTNYGTRSVDVFAPGEQILSTTPRGYPGAKYTDASGGTYSVMSGTSMATPHVTGAAALICAVNSSLTVSQLKRTIIYSSKLYTGPIPNLGNIQYNFFNASDALQGVLENDTTPPGTPANFAITAQVGRRADLSWTAAGDDGSGGGPAAFWEVSYTDDATGEEFPLLRVGAANNAPGSSIHYYSVNVPYRHTSGTLRLRAIDNVGNESAPASVPVRTDSSVADPYSVSPGAPAPLSTGGTRISSLVGDDRYFVNLALPFNFKFFGDQFPSVTVSTNGALYFTVSPPGYPVNDALSTVAGLSHYRMIAGLWDDLRTDKNPDDGVYVVTNTDSVIYRWKAVTVADSTPVNFEIELRRDGTFSIRYGEGNTGLHPIVGISGGEADPYLVATHSSKTSAINLTNAQTLNFGFGLCSYTVTPSNLSFDYQSGSPGTVSVSTGPNCSWTATADSNWISLYTSGTPFSNTGSAIISFYVTSNPTPFARTGKITVAGQTFTVTQAGAPCRYLLFRPINYDDALGGNNSFGVQAMSGCAWNARSNSSWINITSPNGNGNGNGTISYFLAPNTGSGERTGTITVGDQILTLRQPAMNNPIDDPTAFVRQQYLDFLGREPDTGGLGYWTSQYNTCAADDLLCIHRRRIGISAAFFIELEFQETGSFVYRLYRASYNRAPSYAEFSVDRAQVVGGPNQEQSKQAFADQWVQRSAFRQVYPESLSASDYVNKLMDMASLRPYTAERQRFTDLLTSGSYTRAQVLRDVIELPEFKQREYNPSFVLMQYFGYLKRDPDEGGYQFWLNVLNNREPGNYRGMVCSFLTSLEYQQRFGNVFSRANQDCSR